MRLFGSERIAKLMDRMGLEEGEVIQHSMVSKSIERAQKKVEENNFGTRKRLLEYDDVMNQQREVIYKKRRNALNGERISRLDGLHEIPFSETIRGQKWKVGVRPGDGESFGDLVTSNEITIQNSVPTITQISIVSDDFEDGVSAVPVPAAAWLFISAISSLLIGRRLKK